MKKHNYAAMFTLRKDGRYMGYYHELDKDGQPTGPRRAIYDRDPERLYNRIREKETPARRWIGSAGKMLTQAFLTLLPRQRKTARCNLIRLRKQKTKMLPASSVDYVLNTNTNKFHYPTCESVDEIEAKNRLDYSGSREAVIAMGYAPCKRCNP